MFSLWYAQKNFLFHLKSICFWYSLEAPHQGSNEDPQHIFMSPPFKEWWKGHIVVPMFVGLSPSVSSMSNLRLSFSDRGHPCPLDISLVSWQNKKNIDEKHLIWHYACFSLNIFYFYKYRYSTYQLEHISTGIQKRKSQRLTGI